MVCPLLNVMWDLPCKKKYIAIYTLNEHENVSPRNSSRLKTVQCFVCTKFDLRADDPATQRIQLSEVLHESLYGPGNSIERILKKWTLPGKEF